MNQKTPKKPNTKLQPKASIAKSKKDEKHAILGNNKSTGVKRANKEKQISGLLLLGIISLLNLGAVIYIWFINDQQNSVQQSLNQEYRQQLNNTDERFSKLQQQIKTLDKNKKTTNQLIKQRLENLNNLTLTMQSQLNLTQQKINQNEGGVNQVLVSNEADFLIRTAAIRLLLTHNINEATNLLKAADKKLLKINDTAIFPVRAALTKDLYLLKATKQIDVIGSYLKLDALAKSVGKLKINFILPQQTKIQKAPQQKDESWFGHFSQTADNVINKWFQVAHYGEKIKPLVSIDQDAAIKRSITLLSKQAQWSLVQNNIELYQLTLKNLSDQIKDSFNQQDPIVEAALVEIKQLLAASIVSTPMQYLNSEKAMQTYIEATNKVGLKP